MASIAPKVTLRFLIEEEALRITGVRAEYLVLYDRRSLDEASTRIKISYEAERNEGGWRIEIPLHEALSTIEERVRPLREVDLDYGVYLIGMKLTMTIRNPSWRPPDGETFDPLVMGQPGALSNVDDGFGFVGAGYRISRPIRPPDSLLRKVGFRKSRH